MDKRGLSFIIIALAVYRASVMLASEDGPFYAFALWRRKLIAWEQKRGKPHWIIDGFHCPLCISVYAGALGALFMPLQRKRDWVIIALALSSITVLINKVFSALADLATGKRHYQ